MKMIILFLLLCSGLVFADTPQLPVSIGSPPNGLSADHNQISIGTASASSTGALSSTDWSRFNAGGSVASVFGRTGSITAQGGDYAAFYLEISNNLSDLADPATARTNLGLGTAATQSSSAFDSAGSAAAAQAAAEAASDPVGAAAAVLASSLQKSNNFSDVVSASSARTNLGLGTAAVSDAGDLTVTTSHNLSITGGAGAILGSGANIDLIGASIVESVSSVLAFTGATNAVLGSGVSIEVKQAGASQSGYLSSADWNSFSSLVSGGPYLPLSGGTVSGDIAPSTDNGEDLGGSGSAWRTLYLYNLVDTSGAAAIDVEDRQLKDAAGVLASRWNDRALIDSSNNESIDWGNRVLVDASGNVVTNWQNRQYLDPSGNLLMALNNNNEIDFYQHLVMINSGQTGAIQIFASPSMSGQYGIVFPPAQATSPGQTISNDGSGTLSWVTPSSGVTFSQLWGGGGDGSATITGSSVTSGPLVSGTLVRDAYFNNLTISGSGSIKTAGFKIFVAGTLDITSAGAGALQINGNAGSSAVSNLGGAAGVAVSGTIPGSLAPPAAGAAGGTTTGGVITPAPNAFVNGALFAAVGGHGGLGSSGAGGSAGTLQGPSLQKYFLRYVDNFIQVSSPVSGGQWGNSGAGGGGDGTAGGGGGGGGAGGGTVGIWANTVVRGGSTTAGCIQAMGGLGGNGFTETAGTRGGGGGGSGGGGGYVYIAYGSLTGSTATNAVDVSGGSGGSGGNGTATGISGGTGGGGGYSGKLTLVNLTSGVGVDFFPGSAGTAATPASSSTGTAGGAGATQQINL